MKEIIFNKRNYESYKDFYVQIYKDLEGKTIIDWEEYDNLHYSADALNEFLWYCRTQNNKYIFVNFDKVQIKLQRSYDNYEYNIILTVFERFVKDYPNNQLEFRTEHK